MRKILIPAGIAYLAVPRSTAVGTLKKSAFIVVLLMTLVFPGLPFSFPVAPQKAEASIDSEPGSCRRGTWAVVDSTRGTPGAFLFEDHWVAIQFICFDTDWDPSNGPGSDWC